MPRCRMIDPRLGAIAHDANAIDRAGGERDRLVDRFRRLVEAGILRVVVVGGVRAEVEHAHTPRDVRDAVSRHPLAFRSPQSAAEQISRIRIRAILRGNGRPAKHDADASHLSEAAEAGCIYFITHDGRLLKKREDLHASLPPTLRIVTLAEFFAILDRCENADAT